MIASSYDKGGNRSKVVYPGSGRTLVSVYDRANRLTAVQDTAGAATPRVTTFAYDSAGNRTGSTAANGTVTAITFDAMNRVLTHGTKASAAAGAAPLYSVVYGYDLAGQRRTASETVATAGTRQINWDYDGLYRLTEESWTGDAAQTRSYTYDPAGNRLGHTYDKTASGGETESRSYVYDALNRLQGGETIDGDGNVTAHDYVYDLNGNRTYYEKSIGASSVVNYAYDTLNRLVSADADGTGFTAAYDARTRRLAKTEGAGTSAAATLYRYDGGTSVQEVTPGVPATGGDPAVPPAVKTELVRAGGLGGGIGSVLYTISGATGTATAEHFVYNAVGHTVATTDNAAAVTQATLYEAFGETVRQTGTSANNRLRNTKERDSSIGLDNDGFRYYDPATGRYATRDPIGYGDGMNVYASVHNDPVNDVDPLGLAVPYFSKLTDWSSDIGRRYVDPVVVGAVGRVFGQGAADTTAQALAGTRAFGEEAARRTDFGRSMGEAMAHPVDTYNSVDAGVRQKLSDTQSVFNNHGFGASVGEFTGIAKLAEGAYNADLSTGQAVGGGWDRFMRIGEGTQATLTTAASAMIVAQAGIGLTQRGMSATTATSAAEGQVASVPHPCPILSPTAEPQRFVGPWSQRDLTRAANGQGPLDFIPRRNGAGREVPIELHHADQMPGAAIHEVPPFHTSISGAHPNKFNQGVTPAMRKADTQLHWQMRGQEMGNPPPPRE